MPEAPVTSEVFSRSRSLIRQTQATGISDTRRVASFGRVVRACVAGRRWKERWIERNVTVVGDSNREVPGGFLAASDTPGCPIKDDIRTSWLKRESSSTKRQRNDWDQPKTTLKERCQTSKSLRRDLTKIEILSDHSWVRKGPKIVSTNDNIKVWYYSRSFNNERTGKTNYKGWIIRKHFID